MIRDIPPIPGVVPQLITSINDRLRQVPAEAAKAATAATASKGGGVSLGVTYTGSLAAPVGAAYSGQAVAAGGDGSYSYSILTGVLPPGLAIDGSTGIVSGTPTTAGSYDFSIQVRDGAGNTATDSPTIIVSEIVVTYSANAAQMDQPYLGQVNATGGTAPYTYTIVGGGLPIGLTLDANTGQVSGNPTASGEWPVQFSVADATGETGTSALIKIVVTPTSGTTNGTSTPIASVSVGSLTRRILPDQSTHVTIPVTATWGGSYGGSQNVTAYLFFRRKDGTTPAFFWQGVFNVIVGQSFNLDALVTAGAAVTNAQVLLYPGSFPGDSTVAFANQAAVNTQNQIFGVASGTFTIGLNLPSQTAPTLAVTNAAGLVPAIPADIFMGVNNIGNPFAMVNISVATPGQGDTDCWYYDGWCEWTDSSGTPISPGGVSNLPGWQGGETFANDGTTQFWTSGPLGQGLYINYPGAGVDGYLKITIYAHNRNTAGGTPPFTGDPGTVVCKWPGGATSFLLHVGSGPDTLDLSTALSSSLGNGVIVTGGALTLNLGNGVAFSGSHLTLNLGNGVTYSGSQLTLNLGNGVSYSGSQLTLNLGNGVTFSGSQLALNLGNGVQFSGGALTLNLGNGLQMSGSAVTLNTGNGFTYAGGQLLLNLGNGVQISGSALSLNLGNGVAFSGGSLTLNLGNGLTISGGAATLNLGNGVTFSAGTLTVNLGGGLVMSVGQVAVNGGTGLTVGTTVSIANGGVGPTQISSVNISQLNAGTMTVGSGGVTFSGSGGITMASGGNIVVTPGSVSSQGGFFSSAIAGNAFTVAGSVGVIDYNGTFIGRGVNCTGYGIAAAGFNPFSGGTQYFGATFTFQDLAGATHQVIGGSVVS